MSSAAESQTVSMEQYEALQRQVQEAQQALQRQEQQNQTQQAQFQAQFAQLATLVPGFNMPPIPPFSSPPQSSPTRRLETQNNDDDITGLQDRV